jgi:hypothetical protein
VSSPSKVSSRYKEALSSSSRWRELPRTQDLTSSEALEPSKLVKLLAEKLSSKDISEATDFGQRLKVFSCTTDFELNYSIARAFTEVPSAAKSHVGTFHSLSESLEQEMKRSYATDLSTAELTEIFLNYNRFVRDFLVTLQTKHCKDEAILFELFWRVVVKFMDNAFALHYHQILDCCEETQHNTRSKVEQLQKELKLHQHQLNASTQQSKEEINQLQERLKKVQLQSHEFEELLISRNSRLAQLTDISRRERSVAEFNYLMERMSDLISETESTANKRMKDLSRMSEVFHTMQAVNAKEDRAETQVQTDWTYHTTLFKLPCFKVALPSNHLFARACELPCMSAVDPQALLELCEQALVVSDLSGNFASDIARLICRNRVKAFPIAADMKTLVESLDALSSKGDVSASLFHALLGVNEDCPNEVYLLVGRLFKVFSSYSKQVPMFAVQDTLLSIFSRERSFVEDVMADLTWHFEDHQVCPQVLALKLRLLLSLEGCRSSLDQFLEAIDLGSKGEIYKTSFSKTRTGLPLFIKNSELEQLFKLSFMRSPVPIGEAADCLTIPMPHPVVYISQTEIASAVLHHWRARYASFIKALPPTPASFDEFFRHYNGPFESCLKAFLEIHCLEEDSVKVLLRHNLLSPSLLTLEEPALRRRLLSQTSH